MAKRGGFGGMGMPGNMNNLMKQAQRMQAKMQETQKALEEKVFDASVGGGAVTIKMNGKKEITELKLDPDAVDPEDVETLEDLIIAAFNEVTSKVDEETAASMGGLTGGLGGGLF